MDDQAASGSKQASKSPKSPVSGSANARSAVNGGNSPSPSSPQCVVNSKDDVRAIAQQLASQTELPVVKPDVWGVLTPISEKAKARPQGSHILLHNNEHVLGRVVKDPSCQFDSLNVSGRHCTIFRKRFKADDRCIPLQGTDPVSCDRWIVYIKDSSSNGTFVNWQKLKRDSPEARIKDGDIISLVNAPEHESAFAFLYQEVRPNTHTLVPQSNAATTNSLKRKNIRDGETGGESVSGENKRVKGLGIGIPDGPVSLDDVRRLQRSNEELRNQLEAHVLTIEKLRAESRATTARHDAEIKELRETLSAAFLDQIQDLRLEIGKKEKEIENYASMCAQQHSKLEDLNRSLVAANQSRKDAEEVIQSQKLNIAELKEQLEDERYQRRNEREKAEADLKAAVERARSEALEELKRQSDASACQMREQLEMISKLQEADKENRSLVETLRSRLENSRESLVNAERISRTLELRLHEEELSSTLARKKIVEKEQELHCASKELQNEKAAKEEALAKLASLELEMESAIQDLQLEKQRLQGARERIVLRETQLRAFHLTAEEIAALQQKQQEQLKAMMRVLEDGDDEVFVSGQNNGTRNMVAVAMEEADASQRGEDNDVAEERGGSNDSNMGYDKGEKHDMGDADSQTTAGNLSADVDLNRNATEEWGDTQVNDHNGLVDASKDVQIATMLVDEQKENERSVPPLGTEAGYTQLLETESNTGGRFGSGKYLNETQLVGNAKDEFTQLKTSKLCTEEYIQDKEKAGCPGEETLQLEDEDDQRIMDWERGHLQMENPNARGDDLDHEGRPPRPPDKFTGRVMEEHATDRMKAQDQSRREGPMTTLDLLTSEVAGSWALSTPASVHCDNGEWSQIEEREEGTGKAPTEAQVDFEASQVGTGERSVRRRKAPHKRGDNLVHCVASQSSLSPRTTARHDKERRDLNAMLDIVAPDFSRLHGLDRVIETAPDSEDHTEDDDDDDHESDDDSGESKPVSQSVSVSRY